MNFLEKHERWLKEEDGWSEKDHAVFLSKSFAAKDFSGAMLRNSCFLECEFRGCSFLKADLSESVFSKSRFLGCRLDGAVLAKGDFTGCDFSGCSFIGANLADTDLCGAILTGVDFADALLYGTKVENAQLEKAVNVPIWDSVPLHECPASGEFIAWKKVAGELLLELLVPADAQRENRDEKRCRCSKAKVLRIEKLAGARAGETVAKSLHDSTFTYRLGETAEVRNYSRENSAGVYFFMQRADAVDY